VTENKERKEVERGRQDEEIEVEGFEAGHENGKKIGH
jgi:hypothetical protein